MIFPVYLYGHPVLKEEAQDISLDYPHLSVLLNDMFETMYNAEGIGLAAPQVGLKHRIFVVDLNIFAEKYPDCANFKKIFINPYIEEKMGNEIPIQEGCLSVPNIHEKVIRNDKIRVKYFNENFQLHDEVFENLPARVIQHEYDHLNGVLFTDYVVGIRKQMIRAKLNKIMDGKIKCSYRTMRFLK